MNGRRWYLVPEDGVMAARGANMCGGAGSGLGCCAMAQSGLGIGKSSCQQWRRELGGWRKSGSDSGHWQWCARARQWLSQGSGVAAVGAPGGSNDSSCWMGRARLLEGALRRLGRGGDEVNEKPTPSPHFIKALGSRGVTKHISLYSEICFSLHNEFPALKLK